MDIRQKVVSGLRWSTTAKFGAQLVSWACTLVVMRLLEPRDYGLMAMAVAFVSFCTLLNEMGLGAALIQARELSERNLRQIFGAVLVLNSALFLLLFFGAPLIAAFFDEPRLRMYVPVLAFQFPLFAFFVVPDSMLARAMDFRKKAIIELVATIASALTTLTMAVFGHGVWALIAGALVFPFVRVIGLNRVVSYPRRPLFDFRGFSSLARFGGLVSLERVLWYMYSRADVFIIGKLLGAQALGFYSVAMHLASLPMEKVAGIMHQVGFPAFARIQGNKDLARNYNLKVTRIVGNLAFPIFFGLSAVAPEFVAVVLGDSWRVAILPLQLLAVVAPLRVLNISLAPSIQGFGRPDISVKALALACLVMPTAFVIGAHWGLMGVSISWLVGYALWFFYTLPWGLALIDLPSRDLVRELVRPAGLAVAMLLLVQGMRLGMSQWHIVPPILLGVLVVSGAVSYIAGVLAVNRGALREVWGIVRG
ncbi:MAG TPA: lipopolysaccharide biosynthesis protein [Planctomycetota bacterium]|nr:lipopolysaccharide biosynthesis protein [Planctomycetota bacterium]